MCSIWVSNPLPRYEVTHRRMGTANDTQAVKSVIPPDGEPKLTTVFEAIYL